MTPPLDWAAGRYERIAVQLQPAAAAVVELADPQPGESVLDIGCATGSAALMAAEREAIVTGVDPARRLLDVAAAEARSRVLTASFRVGSAESLPLQDAEVDVVLSAFGVIFAADPRLAAAEIARVSAPSSRVVISAWLPEGPLADVMRARAQAVAAVAGARERPPPFEWHSPHALDELFAPHGFGVHMRERAVVFADESATAFVDGELRDHPAWMAAKEALEVSGRLAPLRERAIAILRQANELPEAFAVTSAYTIATLTRSASSS
jgi:SAM-dependent methyltransferase